VDEADAGQQVPERAVYPEYFYIYDCERGKKNIGGEIHLLPGSPATRIIRRIKWLILMHNIYIFWACGALLNVPYLAP
jgi:hypothetical protein